MAEIRDMNVVQGRFFTEQEERSRTPVAVIGESVKESLFPNDGTPLDKTVRVDGIDFTVVGVLEKLGSAFGRDQDKVAYISTPSFDHLYGAGTGFPLYGRARHGSGLGLQDALDETRVALRTEFHLRPGQQDTFDTSTPEAVRGFIDDILGTIAAVVVPITAISLVVGGIVIMNIMLMSVTERTREIGIRMSVGARRSDLTYQILIETVFLSLAGGTLGILAGGAAAAVLGAILDVKLALSPGYAFLAIAVSSAVGIVSGWYPARRAAGLDPVVALRAE
jgi:putative ABC transport system permease protein